MTPPGRAIRTDTFNMSIRTMIRLPLMVALLAVATSDARGLAWPIEQRPVDPYAASIENWRVERDAGLKSDDGWLTVVGLSWLKEGDNSVGSGRDSAIPLDAGSAPARVGVFTFHVGVTTFTPETGQQVRINGQAATRQVLRTDTARPDRIQAGTVTMFIIKRGDRYGVRIRDTNSKARRDFAGTRWFPLQPALKMTARFVPSDKPASVMIANVLGDVSPWPSPGYVVFSLGGREYRLYPVVEGPAPRQLFFIFKDATAGKDTYGGGRFLYTAMPKDGTVVLDFNRAENPPCAYTAFATCPLPPKENVLPVRIDAGERYPAR